jgi:hypothetical protein
MIQARFARDPLGPDAVGFIGHVLHRGNEEAA